MTSKTLFSDLQMVVEFQNATGAKVKRWQTCSGFPTDIVYPTTAVPKELSIDVKDLGRLWNTWVDFYVCLRRIRKKYKIAVKI